MYMIIYIYNKLSLYIIVYMHKYVHDVFPILSRLSAIPSGVVINPVISVRDQCRQVRDEREELRMGTDMWN